MTDNSLFDFSDPALVSAYDELPFWSAAFGLELLKHVRVKKNITALDIGCGTGFPLLELARLNGMAAMQLVLPVEVPFACYDCRKEF